MSGDCPRLRGVHGLVRLLDSLFLLIGSFVGSNVYLILELYTTYSKTNICYFFDHSIVDNIHIWMMVTKAEGQADKPEEQPVEVEESDDEEAPDAVAGKKELELI